MRPAMLPACRESVTAKRIANGEAQPSNVTGAANKINTPRNEPPATSAFSPAMASAAKRSTGRATSGTSAVRKAATMRME